MYGESEVRVSSVDTGAVEAASKMEAKWFGEGLARLGDELFQITWQGPTGFRYSARDLKPLGTFKTPLRDGWGITTDGDLLVLSDGSASLTWVDPAGGFSKVRSVRVTDGGRPVRWLNEVRRGRGRGRGCVLGGGGAAGWAAPAARDGAWAQRGARGRRRGKLSTLPSPDPSPSHPTRRPRLQLEMIRGEIWANVWQTECIARIEPRSGNVTGWVLMHGLTAAVRKRNLPMNGKQMDVLNGGCGGYGPRAGKQGAQGQDGGCPGAASPFSAQPFISCSSRGPRPPLKSHSPPPARPPPTQGIAWDASRQRLFVTGKYWPRVFEIVPVPVNPNLPKHKKLADTCFVA
jgi:glutamine cyclotransferase